MPQAGGTHAQVSRKIRQFGISTDFHDRLKNLPFLCPNCHAQTPNSAGRGKGGYQAGLREGAVLEDGSA